MSLEKRVGRLEDEASEASGEPCSECGGPARPGVPVEYEVFWEDMPELSDTDDFGPDFCPECGRQLVFTVTWDG